MLRYLVLALTLRSAWGAAISTTMSYKDCATDPHHPVKFTNLKITPLPIVIPGPVTIGFTATLSRSITNADLVIEVSKDVGFFGYVKVPCVNEVGTCTYDGCAKAAQLGNFLHRTSDDVYQQIYTSLKQSHIDLFQCPLPKQEGTVHGFTYHFPIPSKSFEWLVNSNYHIVARIRDRTTHVDLGCLDVKLGIQRGH